MYRIYQYILTFMITHFNVFCLVSIVNINIFAMSKVNRMFHKIAGLLGFSKAV